MIMSLKHREIKVKPRIKLNHNIHIGNRISSKIYQNSSLHLRKCDQKKWSQPLTAGTKSRPQATRKELNSTKSTGMAL